MKYLFAAALLLFPLTLRAQDSLIGYWKIDPAQIEQVHKAIEPVITAAQAKVQDPAEKEKLRQTITAAFVGQRFAFIKAEDGIWEQEMEVDGKKVRFPITFIKTGKGDTYEIHRAGKPAFIVSIFDADHLTLSGAIDLVSFPMIRDTAGATPLGPRATIKTGRTESPKP